MPPLIEAEGLVKRFRAVTALDHLDVSVPTGRITAVLGPNGAGKTTLIRTIATLLRPDAGRLRVLGVDGVRQAAAVRRMIGLAGQAAAVEPVMTGRANLAMVARLYGQGRRSAAGSVAAVIDRLGLDAFADRPVKTYSGGQRRRLDLAASLVGSPRLLLLDEPTTGLDPGARFELWEAIRELESDVLLTTQYLDEADQLAERIVIIDAGRVVAEGTPAELKSRVGRDRVEVHLRDAAGVGVAEGVLRRFGTPEVDLPARRLAIPGEATLLATASAELVAAGVALEDITLRRPTLDEVFLSLTGTRA